MCLLDTTDGALMSALYASSGFAHDQIAIIYYSIVLTVITVLVAMIIGTIQLLNLVLNVAEPKGRFWDGVKAVGEVYDIIGGAIVASFVVFGVLSVLVYKPWRRGVDRKVAAARRSREPGEGFREEGEEEELETGIRRSIERYEGLIQFGRSQQAPKPAESEQPNSI